MSELTCDLQNLFTNDALRMIGCVQNMINNRGVISMRAATGRMTVYCVLTAAFDATTRNGGERWRSSGGRG